MTAAFRTMRPAGGYLQRQRAANLAGAVCYVEHHFNGLEYDAPGVKDNPALVVAASNASARSILWAEDYARRVAKAFDVPQVGAVRRGPEGRGYYNLCYTRMPAILVEPLYLSDPALAALALSPGGQASLALILCESIEAAFPRGGLVALSCGHADLPERPGDRGAPARDAKGKIVGWESEISAKVLDLVQKRWPA